uniref:GRF-type domain-containing protein n=1 Tax=Brassica oleracea TaxID=3712 RepID=A0A3P6FV60_BRAOL|nr:unnamed protein product [Brassica oleracea]
MSTSANPSSSTVSGSGRNGGRRRQERQRGIPKFCRCGEEATIKTSGTAKNPGRLFYCCPNGSEGVITSILSTYAYSILWRI